MRTNFLRALGSLCASAECAAGGVVGRVLRAVTRVAVRQVARLFLVSDILHNSQAQVRNASRLRARLESALPDIFDSLHSAYRGADGRMAQVRLGMTRPLPLTLSWQAFPDCKQTMGLCPGIWDLHICIFCCECVQQTLKHETANDAGGPTAACAASAACVAFLVHLRRRLPQWTAGTAALICVSVHYCHMSAAGWF